MRFIRLGLLCAAVGVVGGPASAGQSSPGGKTGTVLIKNGKGQKTKNQDPFNMKTVKGKAESAYLKFKKKKGDSGKSPSKKKGNSDKEWHILPAW